MSDLAIGVAVALLVVAAASAVKALHAQRHTRVALRRLRKSEPVEKKPTRSILEPVANRFAGTATGSRLQRYAAKKHPGVAFSEVFTFVLIGITGGFLLGSLLFGATVVSMMLAIAGPGVIDLLAQRRHGKRTARLEQQLPEALALQASALRAGRSLVHSLRTLESDVKAPLSDEIDQMLRQVDLGSRFEEALEAFAFRLSSKDVDLWVTSMLLHRTSGGDLTSVLDSLSARLRERSHARSEIMSLTAQGRMSGLVVALAPLAFFFFLSVTSREQMRVLYTTPTGLMLLMVGLAMDALGFLWIKWIVRVKL